MRLMANFSVLLATLFVLFLSEANGAPTRRSPGMITLPIRSLHSHNRKDIHPQIFLQQHINRAERRLARMTGRAGPTDAELHGRLVKRMYIIGDQPITPGRLPGSGKLSKRYRAPTQILDKYKAMASSGKFVATSAGAQAGSATNDTSQGVSPLDIQAALKNTVTKANPPSDKNSLGLNIEGPDTGYVAQVQLGTPPQSFNILMDSGSADFWVGSADKCQSQAGGGCGNHNFLGAKTSSTFKNVGTPFNVTYGTGEVQGTIIQDNVNLAGLQLNAHTFGVANEESVDFSSDQTQFDGLMGLAQSGLSQQKTATPVESLASAGLINEAITSFKISRLADQKNDGEITFGGLDTSKFDQATLVTLPNVNTQGFWEGGMDAVTVDGQDTGLQGRTAILDTGTTLIVAPPADAVAVHKQIQGAKSDGQGGFTVPCTTNQSVALQFGGQSFAIDPRDLATLPVDPNDPTGDCSSGISSGNIGGATEWLVGDVFLKNAYFSTNVNKNTVSLAKLV